jgi:transcriptional regulator with XRE-family HTH domain
LDGRGMKKQAEPKREYASVKFLFQRSGMTQVEFAKFCGISVGTMTNLLNEVKGSIAIFSKIAKAHSFTYEQFLVLPEAKEVTLTHQPAEDIGMKDLMIEVLRMKEMIREMNDRCRECQAKSHQHPFANSGK